MYLLKNFQKISIKRTVQSLYWKNYKISNQVFNKNIRVHSLAVQTQHFGSELQLNETQQREGDNNIFENWLFCTVGPKTFRLLYFWAQDVWDKDNLAKEILAGDGLAKVTFQPKTFLPNLQEK